MTTEFRIKTHIVCALLLLAPPPLAAQDGDATRASVTNSRPPANERELRFWLENMASHHSYSWDEMRMATGMSVGELKQACQRLDISPENRPPRKPNSPLLVLPFPGGRHPRIGFLDGAIDPQRETKVSVFLPWENGGYAVVDVPEAIWSNLGLTYLAHTHIQTIWDERGIQLKKQEWQRQEDGSLFSKRRLPNGIEFTSTVIPHRDYVDMQMTLTNGTKQMLTDLRVQNCVMLKGAKGFEAQTNDNKLLRPPFAAANNNAGNKWIITAWTPLHRAWANPPCPCLHSDPKFPDCRPGETKTIRGRLWCYEGTDIHAKLKQLAESNWSEGTR